jgi:hypothetical protein
MTKNEAIEECRYYLLHLEEQRVRARRMQELAKLARSGKVEEAKRAVRQMDADRMNLTVFDVAKLEKAIIKLLELVSD